ncbi:uncharacterized protein SCDLUD_003653 [Saccharomycodes ludwigii]|uniref:uncharacterized protein n=1 Tax=Saccharomycodes ludwigii TaxID=36035 RepID=UPI001E8877BD|nr:hypothetical protein SCDLUD_003653 [Saccharomycodes ludwigii]KAH3900657.1 hypothetical protein SCDLUD_003653 [Saccharomycodes ludwigii]
MSANNKKSDKRDVVEGNTTMNRTHSNNSITNTNNKQHINSTTSSPSSTSSNTVEKGNKGKVAAAALAAAAIVPFPLKRNHSSMSSGTASENSPKITNTTNKKKDIENYKVDPDSGIITCICGIDEDDGFTIQCDSCFRWAHAVCYDIHSIDAVPNTYFCNVCSPRTNINVKKAKKLQTDRINKARKKRRGNNSTASTNTENNTNKEGASGIENSLSDDNSSTAKHKFKNSKDSYAGVYYPLKENEYLDKYVGMFVNSHSDDDWVIPVKHFINKAIEVKPYKEDRQFSGITKLGVFYKDDTSEANEYIHEVLGHIDFQRKYIEDSRNHYKLWGVAKPKVMFHPHWPIYIDGRLAGNDIRYLRKSCYPNVELSTIVVGNQVKFVLRALKRIEYGEELCIHWGWDLAHPIWKLIKNHNTVCSELDTNKDSQVDEDAVKKIQDLSEEDRCYLVNCIDSILGACNCACKNSKNCYLHMVKKYYQHLIKSIKGKMNNRYKLNEIMLKKKNREPKQTSILSRLAYFTITNAARADKVLATFREQKNDYILLQNSENIDTGKFGRSNNEVVTSSGAMNNGDKDGTVVASADGKDNTEEEFKSPISIKPFKLRFKSSATARTSTAPTMTSSTMTVGPNITQLQTHHHNDGHRRSINYLKHGIPRSSGVQLNNLYNEDDVKSLDKLPVPIPLRDGVLQIPLLAAAGNSSVSNSAGSSGTSTAIGKTPALALSAEPNVENLLLLSSSADRIGSLTNYHGTSVPGLVQDVVHVNGDETHLVDENNFLSTSGANKMDGIKHNDVKDINGDNGLTGGNLKSPMVAAHNKLATVNLHMPTSNIGKTSLSSTALENLSGKPFDENENKKKKLSLADYKKKQKPL